MFADNVLAWIIRALLSGFITSFIGAFIYKYILLNFSKKFKEKKKQKDIELIRQIIELNGNKDRQKHIIYQISDYNFRIRGIILFCILGMVIAISFLMSLFFVVSANDIRIISSNIELVDIIELPLFTYTETFPILVVTFCYIILIIIILKRERDKLNYILFKAIDDNYIESIKESDQIKTIESIDFT